MRVLLIEDNLSDIRLIERGLGRHVKLTVSQDGKNITSFDYDLIILDLNLPYRSGFEILEDIRTVCECVPVVVFTTSSNKRDIENCCKYKANAYLIKPYGYAKFMESVKYIYSFWVKNAIM